ncbi:3-phosphoglycerate dehydrogenase [Aliarcobacter trophiarum LMG 25534]|uniref:3-phosphoglycerate dehydrogenase n=1 Tax=Aliarcobacter trophiarum LMG 25534 TaxID=1032241 RepID=A0AAD0QK13_9BACT|nr:phosphoglycerate dehydrogenase [Aliarcobacter trophiarum]AXK49282.1 D-3-phosphoglycerate dehydrogenase [Aliarcobacter trophiarum LMG 25534]RXJ91438.1 3-phosphoglycerate dehydrogenase [Aliarcobacter trophiarum LMG 25534]
MKVFVSTHPFSSTSKEPMELLKNNDFEVKLNPLEHKMNSQELAIEIKDSEILIAGTEKITEEVFQNAPNLKLISRVGIGLDGVDFELCKKYGVRVTYTPDAPTMAVAELCVGMILDLARQITITDKNIRLGIWKRHMGTLLYGKTIGIFGMGRIGKSLVHLLSSFNIKFLVHDTNPDIAFGRLYNVNFVSKEEVLKKSDIISVNIPLKKDTLNYITTKELSMMTSHTILINTARGGIINENNLYIALKNKQIAGAAVDVFEEEPYKGNLCQLDNCLLTCHMGASTIDSRRDMEIQAVEEVIRFKNNEPLKNEVFNND